MDYLILFIFGAVIGSFLNVCIYRIPRSISLVRPGSFCPNCGVHIPFYHNIPLLSYALLKGQCAVCHQAIGNRYWVVELFSGLITVLTYAKFGLYPAFFFYIVFIYFLIVISFIDLATQLIYNRLLIYLLIFGVGFNAAFAVRPWIETGLGVIAGGCSLLFFAVLGKMLFRKDSMGMGDIKLAAVLGFFLGWKMVLLALLVGFIYAMVAAVLLSLAGRNRLQEYLPVAPFLAIGSLTFVYWGPALLQWYWNLFMPVAG